MEVYYMDGVFSKHENASKYISSPYSQHSDAELIVDLSSEEKKEIYHQAHLDVVDFYNKNESLFLNTQSSLGLNFWFLENFRLYFKYRDYLLRVKSMNNFLLREPNGVILTHDRQLIHLFPENRLQFSENHTSGKASGHIKHIVKELLLTVLKFKRRPKLKHSVAIISKTTDQVDGLDRRFGQLELYFDKISSRSLFDHKLQLQKKDINPRGTINSDAIFLTYMFRLGILKDLLVVWGEFKQLKKEIDRKVAEAHNENRRKLNSLFWSSKFSLILYYLKFKSFDSYFQRSNLRAIILSDENSPQHRTIQYAAKANHIQCYGVQHGNIDPLHQSYIYGKYKTKPLLCDVTFTWGEFYTELLVKQGGYRPEQVVTTGRIDPVNPVRKVNPDIDQSKKVVVFASQPILDETLRKKLLCDVLEAFSMLDSSYSLVIRPHPREIDDTYFKNIASEVGFDNFLIDRESDLISHFEVSDTLITAFSTVGTEYIPFYKPLFVLDYLKQDSMQWIAEGVGTPIYDKTELEHGLKNYQNIPINKAQYDVFVKKYFYKLDGRAHERVLEVLKERTSS